ncbi:MAG TPA: ATP-binding protein [Coxiellaceae bacterium]|nr:ATP-binding protein [Coxiellaceae bacterium]
MVKKLAKQFPVIALIGPRQSGKTSLVRHLFKDKAYVNLESPDVLQAIKLDPRSFLQQHPDGAVIDEVQHFPELLSYLQTSVDEKQIPGFFILTGSHQLMLHEAITQSLAGRVALLTLLPLSIHELSITEENSVDGCIFNGFYPRLHQEHIDPALFYQFYFQTYVERDVRMLINLKDLSLFQHFMRLCASRAAQVMNIQSLGNEIGVSFHTIKHWLSILEASFILFRLPPYFENFGKRFIKMPKFYFTDVGLAAYLLGIRNVDQLSRDPLRGHLFENMVVLDFLKTRLNHGLDSELYFYRDSQQHEIDLIFREGHELVPVEIKASATFHPEFLKNIHYFQKLTQDRVKKSYVIYSGEKSMQIQSSRLINYTKIESIKG